MAVVHLESLRVSRRWLMVKAACVTVALIALGDLSLLLFCPCSDKSLLLPDTERYCFDPSQSSQCSCDSIQKPSFCSIHAVTLFGSEQRIRTTRPIVMQNLILRASDIVDTFCNPYTNAMSWFAE